MRLVLRFLGLPQVHLDDKPISMDRRKAMALLAYLAVSDSRDTSQKYTRESLSALFWPDYNQAKAFSNLRRTIWELHQTLGEGWLIAERESVQLNKDAEIDLDVARFQALLSASCQQTDVSLRIPLLVDAVGLYRNHFLTGFSLRDAYPFNEWAFGESEELRNKLAEGLTMLVESHCALKQAVSAIPYARRLITLDPLNESAHRQLMEVYLQAGQHSAALKQYQTCEQILRKELNLDPQLETRALYKRIHKGEIKPLPVEKQTGPITPKHNLPLQLSTFVGREKEQDEILRLLEKNRLVTLAGVGGIGKTRLALQVGQKLLNGYPDGIWFVSLDSLSNPTLVSQTVASIFDIREGPDRPVVEILMHVLREKTTLLILDNCEHLLDSCAQLIRSLLQNCSKVKILATSRELLNMEGEAVYYLPTLSIPEDRTSLQKLTESEAIQLFTERATLALSSFTLTKENAQTIWELCRKVDGIPLAIELAASRVSILQADEILQQLNRSFDLLASNSRTKLQRHQTLQASMDWSWGLLSQAEQVFLRQLSVFAGGWTLESAQAVCDGDVLQLTSALVRKSLIMVDQKEGRETRYRFHEIVRQYVRGHVSAEEETEVHTRHLNYFLRLSEHAEVELRGPGQVYWMEHLNDERNNLLVALSWADKTDVEAGLYLSGRLRIFWEDLELREGARWLSKFIQNPESHGYPCARAKALLAHGLLSFLLQQLDLAHSAAQECVDLYRACSDKFGETDALGLMASVSDIVSARKLLKQALDLSQVIDYRWGQANILDETAWLDNNHERRRAYRKEAIHILREVGDWRFLAKGLGRLAEIEMLHGDLEAARKSLEEATYVNQRLNSKALNGEFTGLAGRLAVITRDYESARVYLQEAIKTAEELGNRMFSLWLKTHLGYLAMAEGNLTEARNLFAETIPNFQNDMSEIGVVFALEGVAGLFTAIEKPEQAARLIGWADGMRVKLDDRRPLLEQADVDKIIAACLFKMGEIVFSDAYDEGQKMTLDDAVASAFEH